MFISSGVVSLVVSHVRVLSLYADGGGRVHVQWEALEIFLFIPAGLNSSCAYWPKQ